MELDTLARRIVEGRVLLRDEDGHVGTSGPSDVCRAIDDFLAITAEIGDMDRTQALETVSQCVVMYLTETALPPIASFDDVCAAHGDAVYMMDLISMLEGHKAPMERANQLVSDCMSAAVSRMVGLVCDDTGPIMGHAAECIDRDGGNMDVLFATIGDYLGDLQNAVHSSMYYAVIRELFRKILRAIVASVSLRRLNRKEVTRLLYAVDGIESLARKAIPRADAFVGGEIRVARMLHMLLSARPDTIAYIQVVPLFHGFPSAQFPNVVALTGQMLQSRRDVPKAVGNAVVNVVAWHAATKCPIDAEACVALHDATNDLPMPDLQCVAAAGRPRNVPRIVGLCRWCICLLPSNRPIASCVPTPSISRSVRKRRSALLDATMVNVQL
jgi:hypothetical protein